MIFQLEKKVGPVVVLVDEYDKPLVDLLTKEDQFLENREILRGLYGTMKALDPYLRSVMLTGVSRFSKVGVFSGMNTLDDISMNPQFYEIVGFNQEELEVYFKPYFKHIETIYQLDHQALLGEVKQYYNGFSWDWKCKFYNPFSILKLFKEKRFDNYWFSTGTPSFLVNLIMEQKALPETFENYKTDDLVGTSLQRRAFPLVPLLFQTGYLTIKDVEIEGIQTYYLLDYPNREVRHSFLTYIIAAFMQKDEFFIRPQTIAFADALKEENIPAFLKVMDSLLAHISARLHLPREAYYHSLIGMILKLLGIRTALEIETDKGRIDAVVKLRDKIFIIEFKFATNKRIKKIKTLTNQALRQIEEKQYYKFYLNTDKRFLLVGIGFLNRSLDGKWKVLDRLQRLFKSGYSNDHAVCSRRNARYSTTLFNLRAFVYL